MLALAATAIEELGPLISVRRKRPELFVPGNVLVVDIKGTPCYVFSGESEQSFTGAFAEAESELYEEAVLAAKNNFFVRLSKGDKETFVSMSGCRILYRYNNKKIYTVVLCVPKSNVTITKRVMPPPAAPATKPQAEKKTEAPAPAQNVEVVPAAPAVKPPAHLPADKPVERHEQPSAGPAAKVPESTARAAKGAEDPLVLRPFERRIAKFSRRIKKNPDDILAHSALGDLYKEHNYYDEAIIQYEAAIKLLARNPFFDTQEKIKLIFNTATLYETVEKYNLALKYYHLVLRHPCSVAQRKAALAAISRLRLKTL